MGKFGVTGKMELKEANSKEKKEKKTTFVDLWCNFKESCTLHGIGHVSLTHCFRGLIWFVAFGFSFGYLVYLLHEEWIIFKQYPFMTSASVKRVSSIEFPAVTFCNMSPHNRSKVAPDPRDNDYHMAISRLSSLVGEINWTDPYYRDNGYFRPRTRSDIVYEALDKSQVIRSVTFDRLDVTGDVKEKVTKYGMCYTWNADGSVTTTSTGNSMNFIALLNVNNDQNYQSIDCSNGFKATVHDPNEHPAIEVNGFLVPPGRMALATISKTTHSYLGTPYKAFGDEYCLDTASDEFVNPVHPSPYSINACQKKCEADIIYQLCGCVQLGTIGNYTICSHYQYYQCYFNRSFQQNTTVPSIAKSCNCPQPCQQTTYDVKVSTALYPSEEAAAFLDGRFGFSKQYVKENFIELHIYFDYLKVHDVKQVPVYASEKDILSNIGGQMGLLMGASLLSLLEIAEFLVNCVMFLIKKCWSRMANMKKVSDEKDYSNTTQN
ncbi:acid-sensing ion channel 3 isoform X2 [Magallana gigas]|uniref:acid-sensing ion channel 3 isoform X2 n=1 Tax=Magallana gigas TaxID=29159 RepID=UPI00334155D2